MIVRQRNNETKAYKEQLRQQKEDEDRERTMRNMQMRSM